MYNYQVYINLEKLGVIKRQYVKKDEQKEFSKMQKSDLPEGVFWGYDTDKFWRYPTIPSEDEINILIKTSNASNLLTIKYCIMFFTVLTVISLIATFIINS